MLIKWLMSRFSPLRLFPVIREIKSRQGILHFRRRKIFSIADRYVCFHEFFQAENDWYEHDHPRDFWCVTLVGGYIESHCSNLQLIKPWKPRSLSAEYHHRIVNLVNGKYSLSISISGPQRREWGYVRPDRSWISRSEYRIEKSKLDFWRE